MSAGQASPVPVKDSEPRYLRWSLLVALLFFVALAAYGSWVPLRPIPLDLSTARQQFQEVLRGPLRIDSRTDFVTNILLFGPIGLFAMGAAVGPQRNLSRFTLLLPVVCAGCLGLSLALEFGQLFVESRTCSKSDIVAQFIGGLGGAMAWLVLGRVFVRWLARFQGAQNAWARQSALLELYLVALLVYLALPLDLTLRPAELYHKFSGGRVHAIPLTDVTWDATGLVKLVGTMFLFLPVGLWVATRGRPPGETRTLRWTLLLGTGLVASIESGQLFVESRYSSSTDVLLGTLGILAGWLCAQTQRAVPLAIRGDSPSTQFKFGLWISLLTIMHAAYVAAALCLPFQILTDQEQLAERLSSIFSRPPLAVFYAGAVDNALSEVLRKLLLFGPLGVLLALNVLAYRPKQCLRRLWFAGAWLGSLVFALGIELAQVWLPPHVPDLTDVILGGAGTLLGLIAVDWLCCDPNQ